MFLIDIPLPVVEGEVSGAAPGGSRSLGGARVLLPAALSLLVLGALLAIVLLVRRNSQYTSFGSCTHRLSFIPSLLTIMTCKTWAEAHTS